MTLPIKDHLKNIIDPKKDWKVQLLHNWPDIIGSLADKVCIEKIYDDTIVLGVFHPCWMQELYALSPLLIKTINEKLDAPRIKQVRFKQTGIKKERKKKSKQNNTKKHKYVQLTHEDERILEKINDNALKDALKAFRIRCYQEE